MTLALSTVFVNLRRALPLNGGLTHANPLRNEILWVAAGSALVVVGNLLGLRLLTEVLEPAEFGRLAIGLAIAGIGNQIFFGPLQQAVSRFYSSASERGELDQYWREVYRILVATIIALVAIAALLGSCFQFTLLNNWGTTLVVSGLYTIISGVGTLMDGIQTAARHRLSCGAHQAGDVWLRYALGLLLARTWHPTAIAIILGFCIGSTFVLVSQVRMIRHYIRRSSLPTVNASITSVSRWRQIILRYGWPFVCWGLFAAVQQSSDRWALEIYTSSAVVGLYSAAFQLGHLPPTLAGNILMQLVYPIIYGTAGEGTELKRLACARQQSLFAVSASTVGVAVGTLLCFAFHGIIFSLFVSGRFRGFSHLLPWMFLAGGLFVIGQVSTLGILAGARSSSLLPAKIGYAVASTSANFYCAARWGVESMIVSQVIINGAYALVLVLQSIMPPVKHRRTSQIDLAMAHATAAA